MEELVAEIGAAFLCADLGITPETRDDHAAYIASWLGPEERQAGDFHRRQPRAERRRLSQRLATEGRHCDRRRDAGGRVEIDRGGRADTGAASSTFSVAIRAAAETAPWRGCSCPRRWRGDLTYWGFFLTGNLKQSGGVSLPVRYIEFLCKPCYMRVYSCSVFNRRTVLLIISMALADKQKTDLLRFLSNQCQSKNGGYAGLSDVRDQRAHALPVQIGDVANNDQSRALLKTFASPCGLSFLQRRMILPVLLSVDQKYPRPNLFAEPLGRDVSQ